MLTPSNIYRTDFEEMCGCVTVPRTVIFNVTQISEEEVQRLIKRGEWDEDAILIEVKPLQLRLLQDKED
jgi:hypothetical protein